MVNNNKKLERIINKYKLNNNDKEELLDIIKPIYEHSEFQRRMTNEFLHHSDITLGEHILEDSILTYIMSKKYKKNIDVSLAVKIAMFHDLYTVSWQNPSKVLKEKHFFNKHGFRHPIEAVINAYNWYPEMFNNINDAKIIIDGIIHHMYPLPVTKYIDSKDNILELKNYNLLLNIPDNIIKIINESTKRKCLKRISFCKSKYIEGKIMSKADKKVSYKQFKNLSSVIALFTGINKTLIRK